MSAKNQVSRQCTVCGTSFATAASRQSKYCSKACMYNRNNTTRKCECCGKEFRSPPSQMHVKTCSVECGYKIRQLPWAGSTTECACRLCGKKFVTPDSHAERRIYCSNDCRNNDARYRKAITDRFTGDKNPCWKGVDRKVVSGAGKVYHRAAPDKELAKSARRRAAKKQATVAWADSEKIQAIYTEAQRISEMTGIVHHVDHAVPLTSKQVCGLHNEFNLQILPGPENLRKHNRSWPDMW